VPRSATAGAVECLDSGGDFLKGRIMANVSRAEITSILGNVDDDVVAEMRRIGASREELAEARNWVVNDEAPMNEGRPLASSRVGRVIALLEAIEEDAPAGRTE
jgi:hypothetical protein